ncbi:sigma-70 family RNA polymerase sigma factor [Clostridium sp.]|uniref:sigma-70 family RNA polymerase sigma factor n=1 Tax=Clostridium sp. TaxID=1506 RepID=UPI0026381A96
MIKIEEHFGLVYSTAKSFYELSNKTVDEINSAAMLGLVLAAKKFDESKGFKFTTFAIATIRWSIINDIYRDKNNYIRRRIGNKQVYEKLKTTFSLNKMFDEEKGIEFIECCASKFDMDRYIEELDLNIAINKLPYKEKQIINMLFFEEKTQNEAAKLLGTTQVQISRIKSRAINSLRKSLVG